VEKIDFLLPRAFTGSCVVIYGCRDGEFSVEKNGRKKIKIPPSGIVKLKDEIKYGGIDYRYFMAEDDEKYVELRAYESFQVPNSDSFYVGPGTAITHFSFDSSYKKPQSQSAFIFFVHKVGDSITSKYSDAWIEDTLANQLRINKRLSH
jgi:hypothetical protein